MNRIIRLLVVSIFLFPLLGKAADSNNAKALKLKHIVDTLIKQHPELNLKSLEIDLSKQDSEIIRGQLDSRWNADLSYQQNQPAVNNTFTPSETDVLSTNIGISKPFSSGGNLSLNFNLSRTDQTTNPLFTPTFNPSVQNTLSLRYQLPLMKDAGRPQYHKNLIAALANVEVSKQQKLITLRSLGLQALNTYYKLLADDNSIRLAEVAVKRSKELLNYQRLREKFGLVEKADRMQTEALVAARKLQLQQAKAQKSSDQVELNIIMNAPTDSLVEVQSNLVEIKISKDIKKALEIAQQKRPELSMLEALNQAAQARFELAKSDNRMQLDVVAEAGLMGLDADAGGAIGDTFNTEERFAGISIVANDLFGRHSAKANLAKAKLLVEKTRLEKVITMKNISDNLAATITAINTGIDSLKFARQQVAAEKRKYAAELRRYRGGRSDTATIIQFEGELSSAELAAESQNIVLNMLAKQLAWHEGQFLELLKIQP